VLTYREILDNALQTLQQHPDIGRKLPELSSAHRIYPAGRHIIVYRVGERAIYVSCTNVWI